MNLHEYQAKQLLADYGMPVPNGVLIRAADEVERAIQDLGANKYVLKAQVHAGGRGKAGGVRLLDNKEDLVKSVRELLHTRLITYQTDAHGQPIDNLLLEQTSDIATELYLGAVIDRSKRRVVIMASTEGGVNIEDVAHKTPEKILTISIDPLFGVMPYQCRELAYALNLPKELITSFSNIVTQAGKLFVEKDLSLLEINPLVITKDGKMICLDAKINIDDNALYRQPEIRAMWDPKQEDEREILAKERGISYISLDGNIGCMVNGAGLAMATMDLIKLSGGDPANFLDVGGGATQERVTEAFKIILSDPKVQAVLVNIFGGIVRCDLIAAGIIGAIEEVGIKVPVVVRLEGNHADEGAQMLRDSGLNIIAAHSLQHAAEQVVNAVGAK